MLLRAARGRDDVDLSWGGTPELAGLDARDRALAFDLVAGTLRRRGSLDAVLAELSGVAAERVERRLLEILRLAAYQMLFLDRVPAHAVVSDAVTQAARRGRRSGGFANAVLRKVADEGRSTFARLSAGDDDAAAAVRHSLPQWVVRRWRAHLGAAAEAAMAASATAPERCLRVNRLRATVAEAQAALAGDGIESVTVADWPDALVVVSGPALETSQAFSAGLVTAQSRGSQLVGRVVAEGAAGDGGAPALRSREASSPVEVGSVVDLCAAPGGKAAHIAALAPGAVVTAVDVDAARCTAMRANLDRLGADAVAIVHADATALSAAGQAPFDHVLLDAPCSGLGIIAARPGLRWRRREDVLRLHHDTETRLASAAAALVAPGGTLTYSVCSFEPEETTGVLARLDSLSDWTVEDLGARFPALAHPGDGRHLLAVPGRDGSSGFFVARLRRPHEPAERRGGVVR